MLAGAELTSLGSGVCVGHRGHGSLPVMGEVPGEGVVHGEVERGVLYLPDMLAGRGSACRR